MKNVAVVYWSGTGNTEAMAKAVAEGARKKGAAVTVFTADGFDGAKVGAYDTIGFGCPAMGAETLEDGEFEPMFQSCEPELNGKRIGLFGSWGWGEGAWMETWADTCREDGAVLVADSVICMEAPDDEALSACKALGEALAE